MNLRHVLKLGLTGCAMLATGCVEADFGRLEITQESHPPLTLGGDSVEISEREIVLPVGIAVLIKALPVSGNDQPYTAHDTLELTSSNPSVVGVFEADRTTRVVLTGAHVGEACLSVNINDDEVECFPVRVIPQTANQD
jgi:hypothetical protein